MGLFGLKVLKIASSSCSLAQAAAMAAEAAFVPDGPGSRWNEKIVPITSSVRTITRLGHFTPRESSADWTEYAYASLV